MYQASSSSYNTISTLDWRGLTS